MGGQEAALTVDWVTPESIVVGEQGKFDLVIRNRGRIAIEQISIKNVLPASFQLVRADPAPINNNPQPSWIVDRLDPQEETRIVLFLIPSAIGKAQSLARVDFHVTATSDFRVVEPKLKIAVQGPKSVLVGNQAIFTVMVRNPGSGKTENIKLKALFPKELQAVTRGTVYDLGTLNPGESRSVQVPAKVTRLGNHKVNFVAIADHNLRDEVSTEFQGLNAHLDITVSGPNFRYLARPAQYKVSVKNTGNASAQNVSVSCRVPRAFAYLSGGRNGRFDASTKTVNWSVGTLDVGQEFTAKFRLRAVNPGNFPILTEAIADRGLTSEAKYVTRVEGIAAILLEVVDVDDPVEVGADTYYEILVTNQGTDFARNVAITATVPRCMQIYRIERTIQGQGERPDHHVHALAETGTPCRCDLPHQGANQQAWRPTDRSASNHGFAEVPRDGVGKYDGLPRLNMERAEPMSALIPDIESLVPDSGSACL